MKSNLLTDYSWVDIIEPIEIIKPINISEYIIFILIAITFLSIIIRYTNFVKRVQFLRISYQLKNSNYARKYIKELIQLFSFENTTGTSKDKTDKPRTLLLNAYYSKHPVHHSKIKKSLYELWNRM